jgi:hypothetical protein
MRIGIKGPLAARLVMTIPLEQAGWNLKMVGPASD